MPGVPNGGGPATVAPEDAGDPLRPVTAVAPDPTPEPAAGPLGPDSEGPVEGAPGRAGRVPSRAASRAASRASRASASRSSSNASLGIRAVSSGSPTRVVG